MLETFLKFAGYGLSFLFVLTIVVTVHELGHFWAGKACKVAIDKFAIGFGKPVLAWKDRSGVDWQVGWIPLGGYVRFSGDENAASVPDQNDLASMRQEIEAREGRAAVSRYYHFKPVWQRAFIAAAGPLANFVLAIAIFTALALVAGSVQYLTPRIGSVQDNSPAQRAGFAAGDLVLSINDKPMRAYDDLSQYVKMHAGERLTFEVERQDTTIILNATPERREMTMPITGSKVKVGYLGVGARTDPADFKTLTYTPVSAVTEAVKQTGEIIAGTVGYLARIVRGLESGDQLSGPLGIAHTAGSIAEVAGEGAPDLWTGAGRVLLALIGLAGFISVGVGFLNLLPLPVLDGGHLLFYGYEALAQRPLSAGIQAAGYRIGLVMLVGLMIFASRNDLQQLGVFQFLGGLFS